MGATVVKCEVVLNEPVDSEPNAPPRGPMAFMRRHWVALLVTVLAVGLLIGFLAYLRHKQAPAAGATGRGGQNGPVSVSVATVA